MNENMNENEKAILAIDCSLRKTGVAICDSSGKILAKDQQDLGRSQALELPFMAERLVKNSGVLWENISHVAVTNGPGYFTGIRVGAAYASGLAFALGAKILPVSSLDVLARSFASSRDFLTLVYAGHGFAYASSENLREGEYSHDEILSWLREHDVKNIISDDPERLNLDLADLNLEILRVNPDLESLCEIACENINNAIEPTELKICYYRAPQGVF